MILINMKKLKPKKSKKKTSKKEIKSNKNPQSHKEITNLLQNLEGENIWLYIPTDDRFATPIKYNKFYGVLHQHLNGREIHTYYFKFNPFIDQNSLDLSLLFDHSEHLAQKHLFSEFDSFPPTHKLMLYSPFINKIHNNEIYLDFGNPSKIEEI